MFGSFGLTRNAIKCTFIYNGYGIAFDGAGPWSFSNEFVKNVVIFGPDSSSARPSEICQNNFWILVDETTDYINDTVDNINENLMLKHDIK